MTVDGMKDFPDRVPGYPFMLVAEARLLNVIGRPPINPGAVFI